MNDSIYRAICACFGLPSSSAEVSVLIRESYQEPENAPRPADPCLVIFSDIDIDAWFQNGEASAPNSPRRHSLSDGFVFVGWRT